MHYDLTKIERWSGMLAMLELSHCNECVDRMRDREHEAYIVQSRVWVNRCCLGSDIQRPRANRSA